MPRVSVINVDYNDAVAAGPRNSPQRLACQGLAKSPEPNPVKPWFSRTTADLLDTYLKLPEVNPFCHKQNQNTGFPLEAKNTGLTKNGDFITAERFKHVSSGEHVSPACRQRSHFSACIFRSTQSTTTLLTALCALASATSSRGRRRSSVVKGRGSSQSPSPGPLRPSCG